MAYKELIKNFNRTRAYMREFYVYGFKSREEFTGKSGRSYDNEKRRLESWLGDYMEFHWTAEGKHVFLSIDSRTCSRNPLYKAWKAKSFTDGDITLHFFLFDLFSNPETSRTLPQIMEALDDYLSRFSNPKTFDESTVRKKLKEYVEEGLFFTEKKGRIVFYKRKEERMHIRPEVLDYFSEVLPCGVIGSFLLDEEEPHPSPFSFKHHYITNAMDSEVLYQIFLAMGEKREVLLERVHPKTGERVLEQAVPLKILCSVQNGRQYVMVGVPDTEKIRALRLDRILSVKAGKKSPSFEKMEEAFQKMRLHMWGVNTTYLPGKKPEHVEFTIQYGEEETYLPQRLEREKRCGTVEHLTPNQSRFSADVYDPGEMIPWIRTFLGRITELHCSKKELEDLFRQDLTKMYEMYGIGGEEA